MVATINLTAASANLLNYLKGWATNLNYEGNGQFDSTLPPYDEWAGGQVDNAGSRGVILEGNFSYIIPAGFTGTVDSLEFGRGLTSSSSSGFDLANTDLSIDLGGVSPSKTFTGAIYSLTHNSNVDSDPLANFTGVTSKSGKQQDGLFDYLGEVGTVQNGTSGNDWLYSFDGNDTLNGGAGRDRFVFDRDIDGALSSTIGNDAVNGFTAGAKGDIVRLALQSTAFDSFAEVYAASSQAGANTVINLGALGDITLNGVTKTALVAGNFEFVA
ncbi:hemolysin [Sinorhizobium meliloti]|uniref:hemolysin n=1 Tax=Rhizobium meliloti TaxID=382 RepID=UPI0013E2E0CC|nr:hemolysin [Sinorhizobium meliloti]